MMIVSVRNIQVVEERRKDITLYSIERVAELAALGYEIPHELLCTLLQGPLARLRCWGYSIELSPTIKCVVKWHLR